MPRWFLIAIVMTSVLFLSAVGMLVLIGSTGRGSRPSALRPDPALRDMTPLPAFRLVDQDRRAVDQSIFDGRITIVDFFFTNCPSVCPWMMEAMVGLSESLRGTGVHFASFSVDPERDTPERLREYAAQKRIDLSRWALLTGDLETVQNMLREHLKFELRYEPDKPFELPDGTWMPNIVHPPKLFLIGPKREVLGLYDYSAPEQLEMLEKRARAAAAMVSRR
jgi:protein SCO1/2